MPNLLAANKLAANILTADYSPSPVESDFSDAHLLDTGDCSYEDCPSNSPTTSPAPVESRGFAAGHFALTVGGQFAPEVGCSGFICGSNSPVLDSGYGASHLYLYDLIV
jgi:hypothetical protein